MMREIKFRGWERELQMMVYDTELGGWDFEYDGNPVRAVNQMINEDDYFYDLMQYTGLKDKNGTEIYEGDIITDRWMGEVYQVIFSDGDDIGCNGGEYSNWVSGFVPAHADGSVDDSGRCEFMYQQMICESVEVIGNIYEHPELLGDNQ